MLNFISLQKKYTFVLFINHSITMVAQHQNVGNAHAYEFEALDYLHFSTIDEDCSVT